MMNDDIHASTPVYTTGAALDGARAAVILIHGRGASADSMLSLAAEFKQGDVAYLAPQAAANTWYPQRFIVPKELNQPYLDSALAKIDALVAHVEAEGLAAEQIVLIGFSQGACLAAEYAATRQRRYGGVIVFSGGLIGEEGKPLIYPRDDASGGLEGTPIFFGSADVDSHIPQGRVHESAAVFESLGANVTTRIYPNMGHTVNDDEITFAAELIRGITQG